MENYGGAILFRIFGVSAMVMFVLHGLVQYLINKRTSDFRLAGKGNYSTFVRGSTSPLGNQNLFPGN